MNAFPIAAASTPTPTVQKNAAARSVATEKADFDHVLRIATSDLGVTSSSSDAKSAALVAPKLAAQQAATSDATSLPTPAATLEEKLSKNAATLSSDTNNIVPGQTSQATAAPGLSVVTLSSAAVKRAPAKLGKPVHSVQDSTRTGEAATPPLDGSPQLAVFAQPASPLDTPEKIVASSDTVLSEPRPSASGAVTNINLSASEPLAQQQSAASAPLATLPSPAEEAAPDANQIVMASAITAAVSTAALPEFTPISTSAKIMAAPPSASIATNPAQAPAASQKVGTRTSQNNAATNAARGTVPDAPPATSLEPLGVRVSAHSEAFLPETSSSKTTHSVHLAGAKLPTPLASHTNQMPQDATTVPATSGQEKDAHTSAPAHDVNTSVGPVTQAALMQATTTVRTASPQTVAAPDAQSAILQSAASIPAVAAHTLPGDALPGATTQSAAQSTSTAEPPHTLDTAQLRVQGNQSELKVSVQLPELGKVEVRAVSTHDATTAHVTAFRHDTIPVLAAERSGLEQALRSHNVILGSVGSQSQGHASPQQRQHSSHTPVQSSTAAKIATAATTAEASYPEFLPDHASISVRA
jgi:hypothetical protein